MKDISSELRNQRGLTLIELLIGAVILGMAITVIGTISISSFWSWKRNFAESINIQDGRQIIMAICNEIRNATQINSPAAGNTTNAISYQINGDTANRTISIGTGSDINTVIFSDSTGTVTKRLGRGFIQSLQFTRDGSIKNKLGISLTLQDATKTNAPVNNVSTIIYTLNLIN